ncbi:hypothetical protein EN837_03495 [bacterium M00.F.Ca.ET.194.01.1.1]|uniref:hypothetical protein n=1 Tax=Agrobacterium pusense TaxID=648995 RepID=UPI000DD6EBDF|nr:hypothetical protein [Agrobacterium pusense]TGR72423.1 hypothetical protein EN837_03495 [bacterium M00.F.Ca.ET.194.01.1.1]TGS57324.1 hypothetical protein EN822_03495 [bacterium M00.F.Ca.ET.179.01.1.1]TGV50255.1 hypothetical protein EN811_03495 [bacterium M00.F.Ca.ET.168.01.1.1]
MGIADAAKLIRANRNSASIRTFEPSATVKCDGPAIFRSQVARDTACLFDLNPSITSWHCMPVSMDCGGGVHVPDFGIVDDDGSRTLLDAPDRVMPIDPLEIEVHAYGMGFRYRRLAHQEVYEGYRLQNAKDLLRYGNHTLALGDRVRMLATLNEHGTLTVADCLTAFAETRPIAGLAQLILRGFVEVDLDTELLGPETLVQRIQS